MMKAFIAQAQPDWTTPLASFGVGGICLAYFMWRNNVDRAEEAAERKELERRMVAIENAANRTTRAILLLVVSLESAQPRAKKEAGAILNEIEDSEHLRRAEDQAASQ